MESCPSTSYTEIDDDINNLPNSFSPYPAKRCETSCSLFSQITPIKQYILHENNT